MTYPLILGLGANSKTTAQHWSHRLGRRLEHADDLASLRALVDRETPKSLTLIVDRDHYQLETMVAVDRMLRARDLSFGVVPVLDEAIASAAADKRAVHRETGWRPERRWIYSPTEARPSAALPESEIVLGHLHREEVLRRLGGDLDLLCMLTHSNGVDAFFGDGVFACANDAYPQPSNGARSLLPCFGGAACNRGRGELFRLRALRARIFAFFACGGTIAGGGNFDVHRSLAAQIVENPWIEACFSSLGLVEVCESELLAWSKAFLTEATAGEAAAKTAKRFAAQHPRGADLLLLIGDPEAELHPLPVVRLQETRAIDGALRTSTALPAGPVLLSGAIPTSLDLDAPLTISYAAEPDLGLNAIRGHAVRENGELSLLLGSEVPIASLPLSVSRWTKTDLQSTAEAIFSRLSTTRRYLSWAVGDHQLNSNALSDLEQLEDVLLQTALYEPALERDGGMLDLTALALARRAVETALRTLHGSLLAWQLDFARMRGSQPRKNYSRALVDAGELPVARPCDYCGRALALTRHANPLDPTIERFALTCVRCWHVGDFASADFPQTLEVQEELRAGDPLSLAIRFEHGGRAPLYADGCFLFEDFQPGGERSRSTEPISAFVGPGDSLELRASLATDPTLPRGRWVVSAHVMVNGGINVLRRTITIV